MARSSKDPVEVEPEVLPPGSRGQGESGGPAEVRTGPSRPHFVLIGLLLDLLDVLTWGPLGIRAGLPIGCLVAFTLLTLTGMPLKRRLLLSAAAGIYCPLPGTERLPLGTLIGALFRLR